VQNKRAVKLSKISFQLLNKRDKTRWHSAEHTSSHLCGNPNPNYPKFN